MKFIAEVYCDPDADGPCIDEVEVEIADSWREKLPVLHAVIDEHGLSSVLYSYVGSYTFLEDGKPVEPEFRVEGCHLKVLDYGGYFRFVFPYRDGPGDFADTDTLTIEDEVDVPAILPDSTC